MNELPVYFQPDIGADTYGYCLLFLNGGIWKLIDNMDYGHNLRVSQISGMLAGRLGCGDDEAGLIAQAAFFHDIGKCNIPNEILQKPGLLTACEFDIIKTHTQKGSEMLNEVIRLLSAAAIIANSHHEKLDGSGYHGLAGHEIHFYARLAAVADMLDALMSKRVYKESWTKDDAFDYLKEQSGAQLDPDAIDALIACSREIIALYALESR